MGRADAAGGEDIGVARPQRIQRLDDGVLLVADDAHLLEVDAGEEEHVGELADILVLGAPGKKLVADGEHGGGGDGAGAHGVL